MKIADLVRDNIKDLTPFSAARIEFSGEADIFLDANESPFPSDYNRYPDPYQIELKNLLAEKFQLSTDQIILGNGSDELLDLIVRTFCRPGVDHIRFIHPSFGMYRVIADINDVGKQVIMLDANFDIDAEACLKDQDEYSKLLFLCSPNNPTGNLLSEERIIEVIKRWNGVVVMDEAYLEFSDRTSLVDQIDESENLIVLKTFSKALGAAGLRLGIGIASSEIIEYLNKIKPPYNVSSFTQQKAKVILSQADITAQQVSLIIQERKRISDRLKGLNGINQVFKSDANFLLVRCEDHQSLYQYLLVKGIIVRDRSKLKGCESCLRFTIGLSEENDRLIQEIDNFYS